MLHFRSDIEEFSQIRSRIAGVLSSDPTTEPILKECSNILFEEPYSKYLDVLSPNLRSYGLPMFECKKHNVLVLCLTTVIEQYFELVLEGQESRLIKTLSRLIEVATPDLLRTRVFSEREIASFRKKLDRAARKEAEAAIKERAELDLAWLEEPMNVVIFEMTEMLTITLGISLRKLFPVVASILIEFEILPYLGNVDERVRSRYNRFKRKHKSYSSATMATFNIVMAEVDPRHFSALPR